MFFIAEGDVPYVALCEFLPLLGDLYKDDAASIPAAEYNIEQAGTVTTVTRTDNGARMAIDADADTIGFRLEPICKYPGNPAQLVFVTVGESDVSGISNLFQIARETYGRAGRVDTHIPLPN